MSNTHSTKLVATSTQYWSITDAVQTGLDITGDITILPPTSPIEPYDP